MGNICVGVLRLSVASPVVIEFIDVTIDSSFSLGFAFVCWKLYNRRSQVPRPDRLTQRAPLVKSPSIDGWMILCLYRCDNVSFDLLQNGKMPLIRRRERHFQHLTSYTSTVWNIWTSPLIIGNAHWRLLTLVLPTKRTTGPMKTLC